MPCACGDATDTYLVELDPEVTCTESPDDEAEKTLVPDLPIGEAIW